MILKYDLSAQNEVTLSYLRMGEYFLQKCSFYEFPFCLNLLAQTDGRTQRRTEPLRNTALYIGRPYND